MEVKMRQSRLQIFATCEISQVAKFYRLWKFATLQDFCSEPFFFNLWLQFPSDFSRELRVRLGFFVLGFTR